MKASTELFDLISSMTKSEKRYLKLVGTGQSSGGGKKYLLLFEAIDAQKRYDEQKILKKFGNETFTRQLAVSKHYLYNTILKSLREFHLGKTAEFSAIAQWQEAGLLKDKLLYNAAFKHIKKAEKSCQEQGLQEHLPLILSRKKEIIDSLWLKNSAKKAELKKIGMQEQLMLSQLQLRTRLTSYIAELNHLIRTDRSLSAATQKDVLVFLKRSENETPSGYTQLQMRYLNLLVDKLNGSAKKNDPLPQVLKIVASNSELIHLRNKEVVSFLKEIGDTYLFFEQFEKCKPLFAAITKIIVPLKTGDTVLQATLSILRLKHFLLQNKLTESRKLIKETDVQLFDQLDISNTFLRSEWIFWQGYSSFCHADYRLTIIHIENFLALQKNGYKERLQVAARILMLLSQFEGKLYEAMGRLHASTVSYILQSEDLFGYEMVFLNAIRRMPGFDTLDAEKTFYGQLKTKVGSVLNDPTASVNPEMRFLFPWILRKAK